MQCDIVEEMFHDEVGGFRVQLEYPEVVGHTASSLLEVRELHIAHYRSLASGSIRTYMMEAKFRVEVRQTHIHAHAKGREHPYFLIACLVSDRTVLRGRMLSHDQ